MAKKKVGFFGGSFDPIHFGHLHLAIELMELHNLDEVIFCPAFLSPHKVNEPPSVPPEHRLAMVALAIRPIKKFILSSWEVDRAATSYTVDTIRSLMQEHKDNVSFHLLLGDDTLSELFRWKDVEELIKIAPPLIGSRLGHFVPSCDLSDHSLNEIKKGMTKIPVMQISSTRVRERLAKKLFCGHLIPAKVLDYIYQHQLYSF